MATSQQLHEALAEVLGSVDGLTGSPVPPLGATPPFAFPALTAWRPDTFGRSGVMHATFDLYIITAELARPQDGYNDLLEYSDWSGTRSVWLAIWDAVDQPNGTFNGLPNTDVAAIEYDQLGIERADMLNAYGGVFRVEIYTKE